MPLELSKEGAIALYGPTLDASQRKALASRDFTWTDDPGLADFRIEALNTSSALSAGQPSKETFPKGPAKGLPDAYGATHELSSREREVLEYLADGWTNEEIADRLKIGLGTVKFHIGSLYRKLGVGRRTEAVREAQRLGMIEW